MVGAGVDAAGKSYWSLTFCSFLPTSQGRHQIFFTFAKYKKGQKSEADDDFLVIEILGPYDAKYCDYLYDLFSITLLQYWLQRMPVNPAGSKTDQDIISR